MGRLIPAGTGFWWYRHVQIPADEPLPPPPVISRATRIWSSIARWSIRRSPRKRWIGARTKVSSLQFPVA